MSNSSFSNYKHNIRIFDEILKISKERIKINPNLLNGIIYEPNTYINYSIKSTNTKYIVHTGKTLDSLNEDNIKYCVLNFANPVCPGGGVNRGANSQEEYLCRNSTLYMNISSDLVSDYYYQHRALTRENDLRIFTSRCIYSPHVETIRLDENIPDKKEFSVITCAAPIYSEETEKLYDYHDIFKERILTILNCAKDNNETNLILGAFGCGAFRNNPELVSKIFYEALQHFDFSTVEFRIYCREGIPNSSTDPGWKNIASFVKQYCSNDEYTKFLTICEI